jgi:glycosyltransferase involved in cell wall biosynthesis
MTLLDRSNTLVIVPAYNEQDSIVSVIEEISATGFPFVVIDDGSADETRERSIQAGARTISLPFNSGVGGALRCGFKFALLNGYKAVIQCDADGQHPPEFFERLVCQANDKSCHLVIGNRFESDSTSMRVSAPRKVAMGVMAFVMKRSQQESIRDTTSGFRIIAQPLLGQFACKFPKYYLGDTFGALEIASTHNYKIYETPTPFMSRLNGRSSASKLNAILNIFKVIVILHLGLQIKIKKFED